jgi:hypothetical protein
VIYPVGVSVMLGIIRRGPTAADEAPPVVSGHPKSPIEAALAPASPEGAR